MLRFSEARGPFTRTRSRSLRSRTRRRPSADLAKDVIHRLAAKNQKAVRQLELTYGGGKTHTLITLYHLVHDPDSLPDVAAVNEFKAQFDIPIPRARVAVLPFDKIDVEKGMAARSPSGDMTDAPKAVEHPGVADRRSGRPPAA